MMRVAGILMLTIFLIPFGMKVGIYVSFKINQDYIANELCENKDEPEMQCNGKCYLSKQMKRVENKPKNEDIPLEVQNVRSILLFCEDVILQVPHFRVDAKDLEHTWKSQFNVSNSHLTAVFHPPEVLA